MIDNSHRDIAEHPSETANLANSRRNFLRAAGKLTSLPARPARYLLAARCCLLAAPRPIGFSAPEIVVTRSPILKVSTPADPSTVSMIAGGRRMFCGMSLRQGLSGKPRLSHYVGPCGGLA